MSRKVITLSIVATIIFIAAWQFTGNDLARIRRLGKRDPAGALELLDARRDGSGESILLRSQLYAASGDWEQAEQTFAMIAEPELCDRDELIDLARLSLSCGIFSLANLTLDAVYRSGDRHPDLLRSMIDVAIQLGDEQRTLTLCEEMSKVVPRDPKPWLVSARIYHGAEKIDSAITAYHNALQSELDDDDQRQVRHQIADLSIYAGDLSTAWEQHDKLAAILPVDVDLRLLRARLLHREGNFEASVELLNELLETNPNLISGLLERGTIELERENFSQAVRDLKRVVELVPENYTAHYKLGLAYQRLQQVNLARIHLERSSKITEQIAEEKLRNFK